MYPLESGSTDERKRKDGPSASGPGFSPASRTVPVALAAARAAYGDSAAVETLPLPQIRLGEHSVSRLICGDNPFKANSHLSASLNQHMRRYYTPTRSSRRCGGVSKWGSTVGKPASPVNWICTAATWQKADGCS